jgi:hypothetical protein
VEVQVVTISQAVVLVVLEVLVVAAHRVQMRQLILEVAGEATQAMAGVMLAMEVVV